jgi:hypothetical protein
MIPQLNHDAVFSQAFGPLDVPKRKLYGTTDSPVSTKTPTNNTCWRVKTYRLLLDLN